MSPILEPLTFDDLMRIQCEENKSRTLSPVRADFYIAMTELRQNLHDEYERCKAKDPDSIICERARMHSKRADTLCKMIVSTRAQKICNKAIISADGGTVEFAGMPSEEVSLFNVVRMMAQNYLASASVELKPYQQCLDCEWTEEEIADFPKSAKSRDRRSAKEILEMFDQIREYRDGFTSDEFASRFSLKQTTAKDMLRRWKERGAVNLIGVSGLFNIYRSVEYTDTPRFNRVNRRTKVGE